MMPTLRVLTATPRRSSPCKYSYQRELLRIDAPLRAASAGCRRSRDILKLRTPPTTPLDIGDEFLAHPRGGCESPPQQVPDYVPDLEILMISRVWPSQKTLSSELVGCVTDIRSETPTPC